MHLRMVSRDAQIPSRMSICAREMCMNLSLAGSDLRNMWLDEYVGQWKDEWMHGRMWSWCMDEWEVDQMSKWMKDKSVVALVNESLYEAIHVIVHEWMEIIL